MPARIRLQRRGKKGQPFYHIVVADGRAPRDGRFIEKIGTYNPLTIPATIELDFERALHWVNCGVQPSDTVHAILRREGIYMKRHLMGGVQKGAFDEAEAEKRFEAWKTEKIRKINDYKLEVLNKTKAESKKRLEVENKVKEAKEAVLNEKRLAELEKERKIKEEAEAKAAALKAEKEAKAAAEKAEAAETTDNVEVNEDVKTTEVDENQETVVDQTSETPEDNVQPAE
ncbi:MAG: 30S ribosomal protein S16 [Bacteroidales bacterium]|jgi:small subunit ribosomal protein S16|nr:30S ribosomal protein S16 [Bacteroidales bacterium]